MALQIKANGRSSRGTFLSLPDSLWAKTAVPAVKTESLAGSICADVAIVGAGFTGLRAALALAEQQTDVVVLESAEIGWGASGRTGGQVNPLLPVHQPEEVEALYGAGLGSRLVAATVQSADELFSLIKRYQIPCDATQKGWIRAAHCDSAAIKFEQQCKSWRRVGVDIEWLEPREIFPHLGSSAYRAGALVRSGGSIQPLSYVRGLARAAIHAGAQIFCGSRVISLGRSNNKWRLSTPGGEVSADNVLICTNGYTDGLWPGLSESIVPLTSLQIASEPLPDDIGKTILSKGQTYSDTRRLIYYGRRDRDGRFLIGSLGRGETSANTDYKIMKSEVVRLFPQLADVKWEYHWNGRVAITRDHLPHLHEPAPGLMIGLGYNGRGVAMSNVMGRTLAERVLGADPDSLPFPITSISGFPFHAFKDVGVRAAMQWMRVRDRLELSKARIVGRAGLSTKAPQSSEKAKQF